MYVCACMQERTIKKINLQNKNKRENQSGYKNKKNRPRFVRIFKKYGP